MAIGGSSFSRVAMAVLLEKTASVVVLSIDGFGVR